MQKTKGTWSETKRYEMIKYIIVAIGLLSLWIAIPAIADTGVSVTATTIIIGDGSGSGSGGSFDSGGSHPYTSPDWVSIFPSMNQPQSSSPYIAPQQTYIPLPNPPLAPMTTESITPYQSPAAIAQEKSNVTSFDWLILLFIVLGACGIGFVVWIISSYQDHKQKA